MNKEYLKDIEDTPGFWLRKNVIARIWLYRGIVFLGLLIFGCIFETDFISDVNYFVNFFLLLSISDLILGYLTWKNIVKETGIYGLLIFFQVFTASIVNYFNYGYAPDIYSFMFVLYQMSCGLIFVFLFVPGLYVKLQKKLESHDITFLSKNGNLFLQENIGNKLRIVILARVWLYRGLILISYPIYCLIQDYWGKTHIWIMIFGLVAISDFVMYFLISKIKAKPHISVFFILNFIQAGVIILTSYRRMQKTILITGISVLISCGVIFVLLIVSSVLMNRKEKRTVPFAEPVLIDAEETFDHKNLVQ